MPRDTAPLITAEDLERAGRVLLGEGYRVNAFARALGVPPQTLRDYLSDRMQAPETLRERILDLLRGQGAACARELRRWE